MTEIKPCPFEPTEEQWSGLARDIMMGRDLGCLKRKDMREHLINSGHKVFDTWLEKELSIDEAHISKGDMCVFIYKAMISAIPNTTASPDAIREALDIFDNGYCEPEGDGDIYYFNSTQVEIIRAILKAQLGA